VKRLANDIPPELIEQLNEGYCVLFVGDFLGENGFLQSPGK
jgi:hypothetical protein